MLMAVALLPVLLLHSLPHLRSLPLLIQFYVMVVQRQFESQLPEGHLPIQEQVHFQTDRQETTLTP